MIYVSDRIFSVGFRLRFSREVRNSRTAGSFPPSFLRTAVPVDCRPTRDPLLITIGCGSGCGSCTRPTECRTPGSLVQRRRRRGLERARARPAPGLFDYDAVRARCTTLLLLLLSYSCYFIRTCFIILLPFVGRRLLVHVHAHRSSAATVFLAGRTTPVTRCNSSTTVADDYDTLTPLSHTADHLPLTARVCLPPPQPSTLRRIPPILHDELPARCLP